MASAQTKELTNKNGVAILPGEADWGIGFNAVPFLGLLKSNTNAPSADWAHPNLAITAKNFVNANLAYRVTFRLGLGGYQLNNLVDTNTVQYDDPKYLIDNMNYNYHNIQFGGGIERRRGNGRVQGIYGFEVLFSLTGESYDYAYGDAFDSTHTAQWTSNFNTGATTTSNGPRNTNINLGNTFGMSTRGFVGVEYFLFPMVSLSAEYGWGLSFSSQADAVTTTESYGLADADATSPTVNYDRTHSAGSSSWGFVTDNNNARLTLMLYF